MSPAASGTPGRAPIRAARAARRLAPGKGCQPVGGSTGGGLAGHLARALGPVPGHKIPGSTSSDAAEYASSWLAR